MSKLLFIIISPFFCFQIQGQNKFDFTGDEDLSWKTPDSFEFSNNDSLNDYDFQIKFWQRGNGIEREPKSYVLILSYKNSHCTAKSFTYITKRKNPGGRYTEVLPRPLPAIDYDSLLDKLLADSLFALKSIMLEEMYKMKNQKGIQDVVVMSEGGQYYEIQLITRTKGKKLIYNCPNTYYTAFKIEELVRPIRIITIFLNIMGFNGPC
jgi:hypothetical protein